MMDWINALSAQDNSLESQMAKRDLTKKLALLENVAQDQNTTNDREAQRQLQEREFGQRQEQIVAQREETKRLHDQAQTDKDTAAKLQRYNTLHDNMKPGDHVSKSRNAADIQLMNDNMGGGQFEDDPNDPDSMIFRKQQFEKEQLALKHQQEKDAHTQKLQDEAADRAKQQNKREEDAAKRSQQASDRAAKAFDQRQKVLDAKAGELSPAGQKEAAQAAKAALDATAKSGSFFGLSDEEVAAKRQGIVETEYDKIHQREQAIKGAPPSASSLVKPGNPNLAPGVKTEVAPGVWVTKHPTQGGGQ